MSLWRSAGYWGLDFLRGGKARRTAQQLQHAFADPLGAETLRQDGTKRLINHATTHVPHYQPYAGATKLSEFPILNKRTIQNNHIGFLAPQFDPRDLVVHHTSGSYGTPFKSYLTQHQNRLMKAELIYFSSWAGFRPGMRHVYFSHVKPSGWHTYLQNEVILNPARMDATWLKNSVEVLLSPDIRFAIAAPSALSTVANYATAQGIDLRDALLGIIFISEPCSPPELTNLQRVFGCPVLGRYACMELGVVAQACGHSYHLNPLNMIVEIVDINEDRPAPPGVVGRVVVTRLDSFAMPLLRYETGDLAAQAPPCPCGRHGMVLDDIQGRMVEAITATNGDPLLPFVIWSMLKPGPGILQYQFVQHDAKRYELRLRTGAGFEGYAACAGKLRRVIGDDADIAVHEVEDFAVLPSGKRPLIINNHRKKD